MFEGILAELTTIHTIPCCYNPIKRSILDITSECRRRKTEKDLRGRPDAQEGD
jgi:hypothetical protein